MERRASSRGAAWLLCVGIAAGAAAQEDGRNLPVDGPQDARPGREPRPADPAQTFGPPPPPSRNQEPQGQGPQDYGSEILVDERARPLLGKPIRAIKVLQVAQAGIQPAPEDVGVEISRGLRSRVGQPLELRNVTADINSLWHERRIAVRAFVQPAGDEADLVLVVELEVQVYERVEFLGLQKFPRSEIDALLGLYPDRQVTSTEARAMRNILLAKYRRAGLAFCDVNLVERAPEAGESSGERARKIVTFRIDEGPEVTVGTVSFRGNRSYPGVNPTFLSAGDYIARESRMQCAPEGILGDGGPFSREVLEEDVERLQLFYRSRGFLDAVVTVADVRFRPDRSVADIDFVVIEGPRYTIRTVRLQHIKNGQPIAPEQAIYRPEEVLPLLVSKVGEPYDHGKIRRDQQAIEDFYGERGHPKATFPGMDRVPGAFRVGWPKERYDEGAGVELTFEIEEGTAKTLRDVLVRGNTNTRDHVVRRKVRAMPGERVDMTKVNKSITYLNRTRFFQDQFTMAGPRFEFMPVPGSEDLLDLAIDVTESETGEVRWGVGVSSGAGAQANLQFTKRNFDLFRPASSWNPITAFEEVLDNRAFHGGGQTLDLLLAPGTQISTFQVGFTEPDLFGEQFETTELRVNGRKTLRFRDGYRADTLGAEVGLSRFLSEEFSVGVSAREETTDIRDIRPDATQLVFDSEGSTEMRGLRISSFYRGVDDFMRPTDGFTLQNSFEVVGGPFGAQSDFWKGVATANWYLPIRQNEAGHSTVFHFESSFGVAEAFDDTDEVYPTERFYLGGSSLRGFRFRGVGPTQFGRPYGGEAQLYGTSEVILPLVATRMENDLRDRELIRGMVFLDYGLLGLGLHDPTFEELRMSYGVGVRIDVPVLGIPIELALGWPLFAEDTDRTRQLWFSLSK
jgi:outer membrane protein insertion porin family